LDVVADLRDLPARPPDVPLAFGFALPGMALSIRSFDMRLMVIVSRLVVEARGWGGGGAGAWMTGRHRTKTPQGCSFGARVQEGVPQSLHPFPHPSPRKAMTRPTRAAFGIPEATNRGDRRSLGYDDLCGKAKNISKENGRARPSSSEHLKATIREGCAR
jgi:hypothetical protein